MGSLPLGLLALENHQPDAVRVFRAYSRCVFRPRCGAGNCGLGRDAGQCAFPVGTSGSKSHFAGKRIRTHLGTENSEISGPPSHREAICHH